MPANRPPSTDVEIYVEPEGANKFKVKSSQLEQIGAQLRGRRQFSIFNSIILPLIVSVATIVFSGLFQYVSWLNSVRLQNATNTAVNASETYEKAAAAIGKRRYATILFVPSLRDIIKAKVDVGNPLTKQDLELTKRRFDAYYDQLRMWNENYDQILTDIDYKLDRPILRQAEPKNEGVQVLEDKMKKIDCANKITEELEKQRLNKHSLKLQFAVIHYCFIKVHSSINTQKMVAISEKSENFNGKFVDAMDEPLGAIRTMANVFRCYALSRIDYYDSQKERSIINPRNVIQRFFNARRKEALKHFEDTSKRCPA